MNHSCAEIVARWMVAETLGTDPEADPIGNWPVYDTAMPDTPDNAICTYGTAGVKDGRSMRDGQTFEHPGLQVKVRGTTEPVAFAKMQAIVEAIDAAIAESITIEGTGYKIQNISRRSNAVPIRADRDTERRAYTLNCLVSISQVS